MQRGAKERKWDGLKISCCIVVISEGRCTAAKSCFVVLCIVVTVADRLRHELIFRPTR